MARGNLRRELLEDVQVRGERITLFRSKPYSPFQRNVSPEPFEAREIDLPPPNTFWTLAPKSSPTTATIRTSVKNDAAIAK